MSKLERNINLSRGHSDRSVLCLWDEANFKLNFIVLFLKFDICFVWEKNQVDY